MEIHSGYYKIEELSEINRYIIQRKNLIFFREEMKNNGFTEVFPDNEDGIIQWLIPCFKNNTELFPIELIFYEKKVRLWNKKLIKKCEYIHYHNLLSYIKDEELISNNECDLNTLTNYEITQLVHQFFFCLL